MMITETKTTTTSDRKLGRVRKQRILQLLKQKGPLTRTQVQFWLFHDCSQVQILESSRERIVRRHVSTLVNSGMVQKIGQVGDGDSVYALTDDGRLTYWEKWLTINQEEIRMIRELRQWEIFNFESGSVVDGREVDGLAQIKNVATGQVRTVMLAVEPGAVKRDWLMEIGEREGWEVKVLGPG